MHNLAEGMRQHAFILLTQKLEVSKWQLSFQEPEAFIFLCVCIPLPIIVELACHHAFSEILQAQTETFT